MNNKQNIKEIMDKSEVLNVNELALLLRVNRKTVYDAVARKQIPGCIRIGRRILFSKKKVLEWING